jgi:hypothetical protein
VPACTLGLPCPLLPLGLLLPLPVLLLNLIMNADRPAGADTRLLPLLSPRAACPGPAAAAAAGWVTLGPAALHRSFCLLPSLPLRAACTLLAACVLGSAVAHLC